MRIINKGRPKFCVGRQVVVKKEYRSGNTYLYIGETGEIIGSNKYNLPDMGLFDINVLDIKFLSCVLSLGESIADEYLNVLY
jgi:hypothetical protein